MPEIEDVLDVVISFKAKGKYPSNFSWEFQAPLGTVAELEALLLKALTEFNANHK